MLLLRAGLVNLLNTVFKHRYICIDVNCYVVYKVSWLQVDVVTLIADQNSVTNSM